MRTIYIECSHTYGSPMLTGIQRVVRKIVQNSDRVSEIAPGYMAQPVVLDGRVFGKVSGLPAHQYEKPAAPSGTAGAPPLPSAPAEATVWLRQWLRKLYRAMAVLISALLPFNGIRAFLYAPASQWGLKRILHGALTVPYRIIKYLKPGRRRNEVRFTKGDVLVLLDSSWHLDIWPAVEEARKHGAQVVLVAYDLIPVTHPRFCDDHLVAAFNAFMQRAVDSVDGIIAISRAVRDQMQAYCLEKAPQSSRRLRFEYFHLGADLVPHASQAHGEVVRSKVREVFSDPAQAVYLIVCTLEPRKNHAYALDAFDRIWQRGGRAKLCLVGKVGWKVEALVARITSHPLFNERLFLWSDIGDWELDYCYKHAKALIFPSLAEGFGLPIIESLQRGLPVIVSDIPVHREIGGEHAMYVDISDPDALFNLIERLEADGIPPQCKPDANYKWLTWQESADMFYTKVLTLAGAPGGG